MNVLKYICSCETSDEEYIKKPKKLVNDHQAIKEYNQDKEILINWLEKKEFVWIFFDQSIWYLAALIQYIFKF